MAVSYDSALTADEMEGKLMGIITASKEDIEQW